MSKTSNTGLGKNLYRLYDYYSANGGRAVTDSRAVLQQPGCIFFALRGDRFDGNDYARQALTDGAAAAVVSRLPEGIETGGKFFVVEDTLAALQELAHMHRQVLGLPVIALTGSNGKTTTKELIARVLGVKYRVHATKGNLNNHIGVPLTLLGLTEDDDIGVIEMGASHRGEIARLCEIAEPDIGLITNIGSAHLDGFGGAEGVRAAKGELYDYLARCNGTAIYAKSDAVLSEMADTYFGEAHAERGGKYGYTAGDFGITGEDTVSGELVLKTDAGEVIPTHMAGGYNIANVSAALAVGRYFGIGADQGLEAVAQYRPDNNRSQIVVSQRTGNTIYMDAYNANPSSMQAAVENFLKVPVDGGGGGEGGKIIILGDMRELGKYAAKEHRKVLDMLFPGEGGGGEVDVLLVGERFQAAARVKKTGRAFANVEELKAYLAGHPVRNSTVLVKGSRGMALEKVYELL